jgi:hypothetical protein
LWDAILPAHHRESSILIGRGEEIKEVKKNGKM